MQKIDISEKIDATFYTASPAAWALATDIAGKKPPYQAVTLTVDLAKFKLPDAGAVHIGIDFWVGNAAGVPPYEFDVRVSSSRSDTLFPRFEGQMHLMEESATHTWIFLRGEYAVPMGMLGAAIDRTVFGSIAADSLQTFLRWFADETQQRISRGDFQTAQQMMHQVDG